MPVYEYKCKECENIFQYKRNDVHAYCCETPIVRVWSAAGISFKGSGFYKTDYGGNREK